MISEVNFTPASTFCPKPQHFHAEDCSATEREVSEFIAGMVRVLQPEVVVETGTYLGHTAYQIGKALLANGHGRLYTLEIDPNLVVSARGRCLALDVEVVGIGAEVWLPPQPIDLIFFDSGGDRFNEFEHFISYLKPGAWWLLHDTAPGGIAEKTMEKILTKYPTEGFNLPSPRGLFVGKLV